MSELTKMLVSSIVSVALSVGSYFAATAYTDTQLRPRNNMSIIPLRISKTPICRIDPVKLAESIGKVGSQLPRGSEQAEASSREADGVNPRTAPIVDPRYDLFTQLSTFQLSVTQRAAEYINSGDGAVVPIDAKILEGRQFEPLRRYMQDQGIVSCAPKDAIVNVAGVILMRYSGTYTLYRTCDLRLNNDRSGIPVRLEKQGETRNESRRDNDERVEIVKETTKVRFIYDDALAKNISQTTIESYMGTIDETERKGTQGHYSVAIACRLFGRDSNVLPPDEVVWHPFANNEIDIDANGVRS